MLKTKIVKKIKDHNLICQNLKFKNQNITIPKFQELTVIYINKTAKTLALHEFPFTEKTNKENYKQRSVS